MVGLDSGAENHTLLLNLGISIHFKSTISRCASPFVTYPKQKLENYFILQKACNVNRLLISIIINSISLNCVSKKELIDKKIAIFSPPITNFYLNIPGTLSL